MVYLGKLHFWINSLKRARPQDTVGLDNEQNEKFNYARRDIELLSQVSDALDLLRYCQVMLRDGLCCVYLIDLIHI